MKQASSDYFGSQILNSDTSLSAFPPLTILILPEAKDVSAELQVVQKKKKNGTLTEFKALFHSIATRQLTQTL